MADATTPAATYKVRPRTPTVDPCGPVTEVGARGSCVVLHGWDSNMTIGLVVVACCAARVAAVP